MVSTQSPLGMAQNTAGKIEPDTVNDLDKLSSKLPYNDKQKFKPPSTPSHQQKKWLTLLAIGSALVVLFVGMWLSFKAAQMLPDAPITIDRTNLNTSQVAALQQVLGKTADGNFYRANLQDYQSRAETLSWVSQVDVKRDWQKGLVVTVIPRQAVAKFGSEKLIDATGKVFTPVDSDQLNAQKWMQLQGDPEKSALIMQQTEQVTKWFHPLDMKVQEVILTPRMTWLFRFDNSLRVLVDKEGTSEKMYQLSILLQNQLKSKLAQIETVDLRYKNGMALTWKHSLTAPDEINTKSETAVNPVNNKQPNKPMPQLTLKKNTSSTVKQINTATSKTAG